MLNWPWIRKNDAIIVYQYGILSHFFDVIIFPFVSLDSGPSFISTDSIITTSAVIIIFIYKGFDQKSRNWKVIRLKFAQYLRTGTGVNRWFIWFFSLFENKAHQLQGHPVTVAKSSHVPRQSCTLNILIHSEHFKDTYMTFFLNINRWGYGLNLEYMKHYKSLITFS